MLLRGVGTLRYFFHQPHLCTKIVLILVMLVIIPLIIMIIMSSEKGEVLLRGVGTLRYLLILSENSACQVPRLCSGSLMV